MKIIYLTLIVFLIIQKCINFHCICVTTSEVVKNNLTEIQLNYTTELSGIEKIGSVGEVLHRARYDGIVIIIIIIK